MLLVLMLPKIMQDMKTNHVGYAFLLCTPRESLLFIKAKFVNYQWLGSRFCFFFTCWVYCFLFSSPLFKAMPSGLGR